MIYKTTDRTGFDVLDPNGNKVGFHIDDITKNLPENLLTLCEFTIEPGPGDPPEHSHEKECEVYYVLEGEVTFVDCGREVLCRPGDCMITDGEETHTLKNRSDRPVRVLGFMVAHKNV